MLQVTRLCIAAAVLVLASANAQSFDVLVRNGTVYDGSGRKPRRADVAINADRIVRIGKLSKATAKTEVDAKGLAVAPGFINMLSWATGTLQRDGRAQSDIRQGVTLEVFGEGSSLGPLNPQRREPGAEPAEWRTLGEGLSHFEKQGVSVNIASFIGATTLRVHEVGYDDREPTPQELSRMQELVREGMQEGALGIGSSLIYAPAFYAKTPELIALCRAAKPYGGMYISHMRSEGYRFLEALDELIEISREARIPAEIYHLKQGGKDNWPKLEEALRRIQKARKSGLRITADMYLYTAGSTGLNAGMPPWVQEGGRQEWYKRLRDPQIRPRVVEEMKRPAENWENLLQAAGGEGTLLVGFRNEALKHYLGKTLAEVARMRGKGVEETAIDLVIEDESRVDVVYFLMSEENVRRQIKLPWMSFGSDAGAPSAEGVFLRNSTHPRTYGNFARLLGRYVRDEKLITLQEAIRKLTSLPARNLKLHQRGRLRQGYYADVVIFDPATIQDHATFEKPHQYSTGVKHVFVNGQQVLKDGEHTGAKPGRFVRGPGYKGPR